MRSNKHFSILVTLLMGLLLFATTFSSPVSTAQANSKKYADAQIIFVLNDVQNLAAVDQKYRLSSVKPLGPANTYLAIIDKQTDPLSYAAHMAKDSRIKFAEPNYFVTYVDNSTNFGFDSSNYGFDSASVIAGTSTSTPQAISTAANQWAWQKINLPNAKTRWNQGNGVKVAVIDTGVNFNLADFGGTVSNGWSTGCVQCLGQDVNGHGTFVAGVIHQVAPSATILPVQVLDSTGNGTLDSVLNGISWAKNNGATVMNMSFSSTTYSDILANSISNLISSNIVVVASAGNDNLANLTYPASLNGVIGVAATDSNDLKAIFSNYGQYVAISAPGVSIYSMYWKGGYGTVDGTSFSAPIIAAEAALYLSVYPGAGNQTILKALNNASDAFPLACLVPVGTCSTQMGVGRVNLAKLN